MADENQAQKDKSFRENINSLYLTRSLCDVTLVAGVNNEKISAHRLVLAAVNRCFNVMFTSDFKEKDQREITLENVNGDELKMLIDFCYTGSIDINEQNVYAILNAATYLEFLQIELKCRDFLMENLNSTNCVSTWIAVEPFANLKKLSKQAMLCAEQHFLEIIDTNEFLQLSSDYLLQLLESEELNIWSEEQVFNAMLRWIEYDEERRKYKVPYLTRHIRFVKLRPKFLCEIFQSFCKKYNLVDLITKVFIWKYDPKSRLRLMRPRELTGVKRLIAIGNANGSPLDQCYSEIYCPIANKWSIYKDFNCRRYGFCSVNVGDKLYILGGQYSENNPLKTVHTFDFSAKKLNEIPPMSVKRSYFAACVLNNEIYVAGGTKLRSFERFDIETNKWEEMLSMLTIRKDFALTSLNGRLFAIGGRNDEYGSLRSVEYYDSYKKMWMLTGSMLRARHSHSVLVQNDQIYAIGGYKEESVECYDASTCKWTVIDTLTVPRYQFSLTVFPYYFYIAGGKDFDDNAQDTVIKVDRKTFLQERMPSMSIKRSEFSLFQLPFYNPNVSE